MSTFRAKTSCIVFLSFSIFLSCQSKKTEENKEVETVHLRATVIPTTSLLSIRKFIVKRPHILTVNAREDSIFIVLDVATGKTVHSWGQRGNGPGEYGLFTHLTSRSQNSVFVSDYSKSKIRILNLPDFSLTNETPIINERVTPQDSEIPQKVSYGGDSLFIYDKYLMRNLRVTTWKNGSPPKEIYAFQDLEQEFQDKSQQMFGGRLAVNRAAKRILYAHRFLNRFLILDYDGNMIASKKDESEEDLVFSEARYLDFAKSKQQFLQVRSMGESFYLLRHAENQEGEKETRIEEYDMSGNLTKMYTFSGTFVDFDVLANGPGEIAFIGLDQSNEQPFSLLEVK